MIIIILRKDYITLAKRIQIPLSLAWAITIHKSQGLTFKYLEVILTNTFTEGQMYVALSRAVSMENIIISGFKKCHLKVNNNVIKFYEEEILEKYIIDEISNIKIKDSDIISKKNIVIKINKEEYIFNKNNDKHFYNRDILLNLYDVINNKHRNAIIILFVESIKKLKNNVNFKI